LKAVLLSAAGDSAKLVLAKPAHSMGERALTATSEISAKILAAAFYGVKISFFSITFCSYPDVRRP